MMTALFTVLPWALPVVLALTIALAGLLQYRLAGLVAAESRVAALLLAVGVGALLSVVLTTRSLDESVLGGRGFILYEDYADGFSASRWLSLFLLGGAIVEILRSLLRTRAEGAVDPAWPLLVSLLAYYLGTLVVQGFFSEHVGFGHRDLYLPIVLLAVYCQPVRDLGVVLDTAKAIVLVLVVGSLLAIAVRPDFVLQRPHAGVIPGVDWRLFGLTPHANTMGPVALIGVLLELYRPYGSRWLRLFSLAAGFAVLALAQSRTAWAAALVIAVCVQVPLSIMPGRDAAPSARAFPRAVSTLVACIAASVAAALVAVALDGSELIGRESDLATLNGRFHIWDITLQAWRENELFGYGPELWSPERRQRLNMPNTGHAHNQLLQSLGEAGVVGVALLLGYVLTLLYAACRCFLRSRGFVLALVLLLLARCVTEAPMRSEGLLTWSMFLQTLVVVLVCHFMRQPQSGHASQAVPEVTGTRGPDRDVADAFASSNTMGATPT